jgi:uncharacterized protein YdhG (YjbR/CyaY superfamily)
MKKAGTKDARKTIDEYLAGVPEPARSTLGKVRAAIRAAAPKETTEGISYQVPMFKYKGVLLGFAAFPNHCSLFVTNPALIEMFKEELAGYKTSKGTIQFASDKPLPAGLLKKLVKARVAMNEGKN